MTTTVITAPKGPFTVMIQVSYPDKIKDPSAAFSSCMSGTYQEGLAVIRRLRNPAGKDLIFVRYFMRGPDNVTYHNGNNWDDQGYGHPVPTHHARTTRTGEQYETD